MTNSTTLFKLVHLIRRHWLSGIALLLSILILSKEIPAWAAPAASPVNQTVPQPTATKEATSVPQATNTPRKDKNHDDDENDNNNNNPTDTPTPAPQQPPPTAQQPAPSNGLTGVVIAERLNVRQGPGTNFAPIGTVLNGQTVNVLNRNATGDWWHICCINGTQTDGWVSAKFIQPNFDAAQANNLIPLAENVPTPAPATATTAPATAAPATATTAPATQVITPTVVAPTATTPVTDTVSAAQAITATASSETPAAPGLALTMEQTPTLVWQGHTFELHFTVTNTTEAKATQVELRDELPQELKFISAEASNAGKVVPQDSSAGRYVVDIQWPTLAVGATVTATVKVQIADKVANGSVIDNLAVAIAAGLDSTTAGVSIGLPPASPPDFQ